jgi:tRNA(Arg) A34 adenosine deaminase TadA
MESNERTKHGCVIVKSGAVQSKGTNTYRNQPGIIEEIEALSVHAEINAIRRGSNLRGAVAYIARVNNSGEKRQSRPCPDCLKALKDAGVKRIVYTVSGEEYL